MSKMGRFYYSFQIFSRGKAPEPPSPLANTFCPTQSFSTKEFFFFNSKRDSLFVVSKFVDFIRNKKKCPAPSE